MNRIASLSVILIPGAVLLSNACATGQTALVPPEESQNESTPKGKNGIVTNGAAPVIAITTVPAHWSRNPALLTLAVWEDGRVVFAREPAGTTEHREGRVSAKAVTRCLKRLREAGVFEFPYENSAHYGPDSEFVVLYARNGEDEIELKSWHEIFERDGRHVVNSHGVHSHQGRERESLLDPPDSPYVKFRRIWDVTKRELLALIPEESEPFDGDWEATYDRVGEVSFELQKKRYFERLEKKARSE